MRVDLYPELAAFVRGLAKYLQSYPSSLLFRRSGEVDVRDISLHFKGQLSASAVKKAIKEAPCVLCKERISYKPAQFLEKKVALPFLIVIHNALILKGDVFYAKSEENELFIKIVENTTGYHPNQFLVRELLRCHFDALPNQYSEKWIQNCAIHIQEDIARYHIRGALVFGEAAAMLFPKREELWANVGKKINLWGIPAVLSPGPARILYLIQKKYPEAEIQKEKRRIYEAVLLFKKEIMRI